MNRTVFKVNSVSDEKKKEKHRLQKVSDLCACMWNACVCVRRGWVIKRAAVCLFAKYECMCVLADDRTLLCVNVCNDR